MEESGHIQVHEDGEDLLVGEAVEAADVVTLPQILNGSVPFVWLPTYHCKSKGTSRPLKGNLDSHRLPICFLTSDLTNQKEEQKNSDYETSWLV